MDESGTSTAAVKLARCRAGVAAVEYAFAAALIGLALVGVLSGTGDGVERRFDEVNSAMPDGSGFRIR